MKCLQCQKDFEPKRESAKYCSGKCKVKYHRKNGGKNTIKPFQMQVLYNSIVELIEKGQQQQFMTVNPMPKELHALEQNLKNKDQFTFVKEERLPTFQEVLNGMSNLQFGDEKEEYAEKINSYTHLSEKQIKLLLGNLWAK